MNDLISRQAAISAICNACGKIDCDQVDKCEKLQLPPANCSEFPNSSDTISRQAAIDAVAEGLKNTFIEYRDVAEKMIGKIPSAQPERPNGEWINRSLNIMYPEWERYTCSACGKHAYNYDFCPNCGADMRERREE